MSKPENATTILRRCAALALEAYREGRLLGVDTNWTIGSRAKLVAHELASRGQQSCITTAAVADAVSWLIGLTEYQRYIAVETGNTSRIGRHGIATRDRASYEELVMTGMSWHFDSERSLTSRPFLELDEPVDPAQYTGALDRTGNTHELLGEVLAELTPGPVVAATTDLQVVDADGSLVVPPEFADIAPVDRRLSSAQYSLLWATRRESTHGLSVGKGTRWNELTVSILELDGLIRVDRLTDTEGSRAFKGRAFAFPTKTGLEVLRVSA